MNWWALGSLIVGLIVGFKVGCWAAGEAVKRMLDEGQLRKGEKKP